MSDESQTCLMRSHRRTKSETMAEPNEYSRQALAQSTNARISGASASGASAYLQVGILQDYVDKSAVKGSTLRSPTVKTNGVVQVDKTLQIPQDVSGYCVVCERDEDEGLTPYVIIHHDDEDTYENFKDDSVVLYSDYDASLSDDNELKKTIGVFWTKPQKETLNNGYVEASVESTHKEGP